VILETHSLCKRFGGLQAVRDVSVQIPTGGIFGLIGPNGAGKTTLLNSISGYYRPESGNTFFKGKKITGLRADQICHRGIARTFQVVHSFPKMTVLENVEVGAVFGNRKTGENPEDKSREMLRFVEFPLSPDTLAGQLNTIQLKRLELARALSSNCELLLLDEVAAGLTSGELGDLIKLIKKINASGITIIIVEHLMRLIMSVCDRIAVLSFGEIIAEGTPGEIVANETVTEAYLGKKYMH